MRAARIVVAAGLGTPRLAAQVGLDVPVRPVRGQNLVTERLAPILPLPASAIRQTDEGTMQIGVTNEDDGTYDPITRTADLARMAARAVRVLPPLAQARIVRAWGGAAADDAGRLPRLCRERDASRRLRRRLPFRRDAGRRPMPARWPPGSWPARLPEEIAALHPDRFTDCMFQRTEPAHCLIRWDGRDLPARAGEPLAAALLAGRHPPFRETRRVRHAARPALHDGRLLRLPRRDGRRAATAGLHGDGAPACARRPSAARGTRPTARSMRRDGRYDLLVPAPARPAWPRPSRRGPRACP